MHKGTAVVQNIASHTPVSTLALISSMNAEACSHAARVYLVDDLALLVALRTLLVHVEPPHLRHGPRQRMGTITERGEEGRRTCGSLCEISSRQSQTLREQHKASASPLPNRGGSCRPSTASLHRWSASVCGCPPPWSSPFGPWRPATKFVARRSGWTELSVNIDVRRPAAEARQANVSDR